MGTSVRSTIGVQFQASGVEGVRNGMRLVRTEAQETAKAGEAISGTAIFGIAELSRGLSRVAMEGTASSMAMRELAGGIMRVGAGFGTVAALVGIFTLLGGTIAEVFLKARREIEQTRQKFDEELGRMSNAGDATGIQKKARDLYFGTPYDDKGHLRNPSATPGAFQGSLLDLRNRMAYLRSRLLVGGTFQNDIANQPINAAIRALQPQLDAVEQQWKQLTDAMDVLASQPEKMQGIIPMKITAQTTKAEARSDQRLIDDLMTMIKKQKAPPVEAILTPEMAGDIAANQAHQLDDLVKKYNPAAAGDMKSRLSGLSGVHATAAKIDWNAVINTTALQSAEAANQLGEKIQTQFSDMIGKSISEGIQQGIKSHSLSGAFSALGKGVLSGLGSIMIEVGEKALASMALIKTISEAIAGMNWGVGIPAALGLIALGSVLESAGSSSSHSASVASGGYGGPGAYVGAPITVNPGGTVARASGISPAAPIVMNATFIGPRDPVVQRQLLETLDLAQRRGKTGYGL